MNEFEELISYLQKHCQKDLTTHTVSKGELLFSEIECSNHFYILTNGVVELFKVTNCLDERVLFLLKAPALLNEEIIFSSPCENSTSARTFVDSEIIKVPKNIFINLVNENLEITSILNKSLNNKLRRCYRQLKNSGTNITINKKVASKLWKLAYDYGKQTDEGLLINFSLSVTMLAKMIGTKRETVSRCINNLKKEGIIHYHDGQFVIVDLDSLAFIYNGECEA